MEIIDKKIEYVECVACEEYVETFNHNESSDMCNDCHAESILCRICYKLVSPDQFRAVRNQCKDCHNAYQSKWFKHNSKRMYKKKPTGPDKMNNKNRRILKACLFAKLRIADIAPLVGVKSVTLYKWRRTGRLNDL